MGPPEQRCWVDGEQVVERGDQNVGGAVAGAVIGGNSGSGDNVAYDRNVQRCRNLSSGRPAYWDVTYNYRGLKHRAQMRLRATRYSLTVTACRASNGA